MKKPKTIKDIEQDPRVESIHHEGDDGWWVYLAVGWMSEWETRTIHEPTIKKVCDSLHRSIVYRCEASDECEGVAIVEVNGCFLTRGEQGRRWICLKCDRDINQKFPNCGSNSLEDYKRLIENWLDKPHFTGKSITKYFNHFCKFGENIHSLCTSKMNQSVLGKVISWDEGFMLFETWDIWCDESGVRRNSDGSLTPGNPGIRKLMILPNSAVQMIQECDCAADVDPGESANGQKKFRSPHSLR